MRQIFQFLLFFLTVSSLRAQTVHVGGNLAYFGSYLFNKGIDFTGDDTVYVFSGGYGAGLSGSFYFDAGGYYLRKIYGVKTELNFTRHNQSYKVFPGSGPAKPNQYYTYRTRLSYLDIPVMFAFCPTHHQGFTVECGPQISFLQNATVKPVESMVEHPASPMLTKRDFRNVTFSGVIGAGIFYSFTEHFAFIGTFRFGYSFSDVTTSVSGITPYYPTTRAWAGAYLQAVYKFNQYGSDKNRGYDYYKKKLSD